MTITNLSRWFLAALCFWSIAGANAETLIWNRQPIQIDLVVGVEQMVMLPSDGAVGLPSALANGNVFRTLVTSGAAYWTALEPFERERIQVRLDTGEFLLFDVSARTEKQPPAVVSSIHIVMGDASARESLSVTAEESASLFELIRYAAQSVYSPERLIAPLNTLRAIPVGLSGSMNTLYDNGEHKGLVIQPYKAWTAGELYVTAFIVTNEHNHPMTLDNRKVKHAPMAHRTGVAPHFIASAFYHTKLPSRTSRDNRTTLFVVTDRPIRSIIRGA